MRALLIEVRDIGPQRTPEVGLPQNEQVVETLAPDTAKESFAEGIHLGCRVRRAQDFDAALLRQPQAVQQPTALPLTRAA